MVCQLMKSFKTMRDLVVRAVCHGCLTEVTMDTSFEEDLGADSVDLVELVMAMEEEFDMGETDEDELAGLKTVGDCVRISVRLAKLTRHEKRDGPAGCAGLPYARLEQEMHGTGEKVGLYLPEPRSCCGRR